MRIGAQERARLGITGRCDTFVSRLRGRRGYVRRPCPRPGGSLCRGSPSPGRRVMSADYMATTRSIVVTVQPFYLDDQSEPDEGRFVWALSRPHPQYRDRDCSADEPLLADYRRQRPHHQGRRSGRDPANSRCSRLGRASNTPREPPLDTPTGFMQGFYHMITPTSGEQFDVEIPAFSLDSPHSGRQLH